MEVEEVNGGGRGKYTSRRYNRGNREKRKKYGWEREEHTFDKWKRIRKKKIRNRWKMEKDKEESNKENEYRNKERN